MKFHRFSNIWRPELYQGNLVMKEYFEGWYYKLVDNEGKYVCAVIAGVSFDREGKNNHCFIQFLSNKGNQSSYSRYPIKEFSYGPDNLDITIGGSRFRLNGIDLEIEDDTCSIQGSLTFHNLNPWPVKLFAPGAMGWYAFVPFMECYHGVLSFNHQIEGQLSVDGETIDMNGGKGYIEKDWGKSFPKYHIWLQTNHFNDPGTSLMGSLANIPWLGKYFDGFLFGLLYHEKLYTFTSYSGATIEKFEYKDKQLTIHLRSRHHLLEVEVFQSEGTELRAPVTGQMVGRLVESLSATTRIGFYAITKNGRELLVRDTGKHTGLEVQGEIPNILKL